ncbi:MAG: hypothetical protein IKN21_00960 [Prevotella sp.]|nr:hypothetical protein [Prevotella sp.]
MEELLQLTSEEIADRLKALSDELMHRERNDLLLRALGVSTLEKLRLEAAKGRLSRLLITKDYRFILPDYENKEVELQPVHEAVYLLFLAHPEGIEFKQLSDYREELLGYYLKMSQSIDKQKVEESIDRLVNPLDNAINEKCSRIKNVFLSLMDEYSASYYIVSSHVRQPIASSPRIWYRRLKNIALPRNLVVWESE